MNNWCDCSPAERLPGTSTVFKATFHTHKNITPWWHSDIWKRLPHWSYARRILSKVDSPHKGSYGAVVLSVGWKNCWTKLQVILDTSKIRRFISQWLASHVVRIQIQLYQIQTPISDVLCHCYDNGCITPANGNTEFPRPRLIIKTVFPGTNGPLYVTSSYSTGIFCRGVSGFATDCPCGVWCRGLTTCLLHVGPPFGNRILNNSWTVGLT